MSSIYQPPNRDEIKKEYTEKVPLYQNLIEEVMHILDKCLINIDLEISDITDRVKSFKSFYKKIIINEIEKNIFNEIEDIAGIRVICLYRQDLLKINKIINEEFYVIKEELHTEKEMPFGYLSDHYVVKIPEHFIGVRYDSIKELKCEIQIRTVSMHAWATISHHLDYKQEDAIPTKFKRDFNALSGVFYIADSLFERFREARENSVRDLIESVERDEFDLKQEINLDTIKAFLSWKLPDRKTADDVNVSKLVTQLREKGVSFKDINKNIDEEYEIFKEYEISDKRKEENRYPGFFSNTGVIRLLSINTTYINQYKRDLARAKSK